MWALAAAGALAAVIVGWNVVSSLFDATVRSSADVEFEFSTPQELLAAAEPVSLGNPDAPLTLMEFGDYQCPACQNFYRQAKPILDVSYIEPGRVRFEFYDFPLEATHPNAFLAARAARCAGDQDRYWDYHDRLFQNQVLWSFEPDPAGAFNGYADDLGLDGGEFRSCLRSDRHAEVVVANQMLGIQARRAVDADRDAEHGGRPGHLDRQLDDEPPPRARGGARRGGGGRRPGRDGRGIAARHRAGSARATAAG